MGNSLALLHPSIPRAQLLRLPSAYLKASQIRLWGFFNSLDLKPDPCGRGAESGNWVGKSIGAFTLTD